MPAKITQQIESLNQTISDLNDQIKLLQAQTNENIDQIDDISGKQSSLMSNISYYVRSFINNSILNHFKINNSTIETDLPIKTGVFEIIEDSGAITLIDLPVSSTPATGTEQSYTSKIDGDNITTIYAEADSSGGIQNKKYIVHCGLNLKEIDTPTAKTDYGAIYTKSDNNMYFQDGDGTEHTIAFV